MTLALGTRELSRSVWNCHFWCESGSVMSRVLVVDDDVDGMEAVCRFLEKAGHDVMCKHNGREALAGLPTFSPNVVVLDLLMPEMDGVEFLEVLRKYYRGLTLPVVLLTAVPEG